MYDLPDVALQGMPQLEQTGAHSEMPPGTMRMIACRASLRQHTNVSLNLDRPLFPVVNLRTRGKNPALVKKFISRSPYSQSIEATLYPKECLNQTLNVGWKFEHVEFNIFWFNEIWIKAHPLRHTSHTGKYLQEIEFLVLLHGAIPMKHQDLSWGLCMIMSAAVSGWGLPGKC